MRVTPNRPSLVTTVLATTLGAALLLGLPGPAAVADSPGAPSTTDSPAAPDSPVTPAAPEPGEVLERATDALIGEDAATEKAEDAEERVEATLALRDLFLARSTLRDGDAEQADRLLARPTDGASDPYGDGYAVPEARLCAAHTCVHWVRSGPDAPPSDAWAEKTLDVVEKVWRHHVGRLGYRKPASDGSRGGNAKFDVYLTELGRSRGLYGYCAPESRVKGQAKQASGFCVLDNDFARSEFGRAPMKTMRVTAAHEFFHAIQFAYDFTEDPWLIESTATWIEERFADGVNDNRNYLRYGQASRATQPLDLFDGGGLAHYGNWVFWEYLSERFGNKIVRRTIERAGTGGGLPDDYSTQALRKVLKNKGGLPRVYAAFAAANTQPGRSYDEGGAFPGVDPVKTTTVSRKARRTTFGTRIKHLAAKTLKLKARSLASKKWRLKVSVDGPKKAASPAVALLVLRDNGTLRRRTIDLDKSGDGTRKVGFDSRKVRWVSVTLANASTRYQCDTGSGYACEGRPRDQRERFEVTAKAVRR